MFTFNEAVLKWLNYYGKTYNEAVTNFTNAVINEGVDPSEMIELMGDVMYLKRDSGYTLSEIAGILAGGAAPGVTEVRAIFMGQSEIEHLFNRGSYYDMLPVPDVTGTNMIVISQSGDLQAPEEYEVTAENIAAGLVSEAMGALACYLRDIVGSNTRFIIGDGAVPGTSRRSLADTSTDGSETIKRYWQDFLSVVSLIENNYGPVEYLVECWYNADAGSIPNFKDNFWPFYFGVDPQGNEVEIGTTYAASTPYQVDHILWDALAPDDQKGRGVFRKDQTKWRILTMMPFNNGAEEPAAENINFSEYDGRLSEPDRETMMNLVNETEAQSVDLIVGPSGHLVDFDGGIHPIENTDPNGKGLFAMAFAAPIATAAGEEILEPYISDVEGPTDGSYIDVVVELPNGGTLTTLRQLRQLDLNVTTSPHHQEVTGFELFRSSEGIRRPVFNTYETDYPQEFRGTVTIVDSGSGSPKKGRVRITMENNAEFSDSISYLRGQATAILLRPRDADNKLFLDMLIEHIPKYYNSEANYTYEGVPVRPLQSDIPVTVLAPPFQSRGVEFYSDGTDGDGLHVSTSIPVTESQGTIAYWFKQDDPAWPQLKHVAQFREGSNTKFTVRTGNDCLFFSLVLQDGSTKSLQFNETALTSNGGTAMQPDVWYHVAHEWIGTTIKTFVNGNLIDTSTLSDVAWSGNLTALGIGSYSYMSPGAAITASLGHMYLNLNERVDLEQNIDMFIDGNGYPVDLGGNGEIPTGSAPELYFDGDGSSWNNVGTAGPFNLTGALEVAAPAPGYMFL